MIRDHVKLARVDHWFKNVFMLPGIVLGWLMYGPVNPISTLTCVLIGVVSTCLVCSSNFILAAPVLAGFMGMYVRIGFLPNSPAQPPETLYKQKALLAYGLVTVLILIVCYVVRIPWLSHIFEPTIPQNL